MLLCLQTIQHGACLGLGLAALGTDDEEIFEDIKAVLFMDNAIAGEAAGISLGLIAAGSATEKATELLAYAHDTQHEKVRHVGHSGRRESGTASIIREPLGAEEQIWGIQAWSGVQWGRFVAVQVPGGALKVNACAVMFSVCERWHVC